MVACSARYQGAFSFSKRLLSALLSAALIVGVMPSLAFALEEGSSPDPAERTLIEEQLDPVVQEDGVLASGTEAVLDPESVPSMINVSESEPKAELTDQAEEDEADQVALKAAEKPAPILKDGVGNAVELKKIGEETGAMFKYTSPGGGVYLASLPYGATIGSLESTHRGWFDVFYNDGAPYVSYKHYGSGNTIAHLDASIFESHRLAGQFFKDSQFADGLGYEYDDLLSDLTLSEQPATEGVEGLVITFSDEYGLDFGTRESWTIFIQISTEKPTVTPEPDPDEPAPVPDPADPEPAPGMPAGFDAAYGATASHLAATDPSLLSIASTGGEWLILGLARSEAAVPEGFYDAYKDAVAQTLTDKGGVLHRVKYTEYSRVILGLSALGQDVTNVAGYNLLERLADFENVCWQGVNGPIWALIALDSGGYEIPVVEGVAVQATREMYIQRLLDLQNEKGGWALAGTGSDPDVTAMAIQALAPYYGKDLEVTAAVDEALATLSVLQQSNGGYASWGTVNAESCAQVVVALTALGIDPTTDGRFVKDGSSVLDALLSFAVEGGGFKHTQDGKLNGMATEQGYYALAAYDRFKQGKTSLYDMSDVLSSGEEPGLEDPSVNPSAPGEPKPPVQPDILNGETAGADASGGSAPAGASITFGGRTVTLGAALAKGTPSDDLMAAEEVIAATAPLPEDVEDLKPPLAASPENAEAAHQGAGLGWLWVLFVVGGVGVFAGAAALRRREEH